MTGHAYIIGTGSFLPGPPIPNAEMQRYIGQVGPGAGHGRRILRFNGIKSRHYALDPDGTPLQSNAGMAALAVENALAGSGCDRSALDYLATATTQGDLLVPGHASQVHAELGAPSLAIANFQSVCASSMMAMRAAMLEVAHGGRTLAAVTGSEFSSRFFRPGFYRPFLEAKGEARPPFEAEFLRWTLSDGAGAVLMAPEPMPDAVNLKVEWLDLVSLADRFEPCMYAGIPPHAGGDLLKSWSHYATPVEAVQDAAMLLLQDFSRLKTILAAWCERYLYLAEAGRIDPAKVDHFLCHYSAQSLREGLIAQVERTGAMVPEEKWFSNLTTKGNTGSAAIFIMLDELMRSGRCRPGQRILCAVPESGRGLIAFMELSVI